MLVLWKHPGDEGFCFYCGLREAFARLVGREAHAGSQGRFGRSPIVGMNPSTDPRSWYYFEGAGGG